jgi:hypothetical protein
MFKMRRSPRSERTSRVIFSFLTGEMDMSSIEYLKWKHKYMQTHPFYDDGIYIHSDEDGDLHLTLPEPTVKGVENKHGRNSKAHRYKGTQ